MVTDTTLDLIEAIALHQQGNPPWADIAHKRASEVYARIARLRRFASHDPTSKPSLFVTAQADELESRLDRAMLTIAERGN